MRGICFATAAGGERRTSGREAGFPDGRGGVRCALGVCGPARAGVGWLFGGGLNEGAVFAVGDVGSESECFPPSDFGSPSTASISSSQLW